MIYSLVLSLIILALVYFCDCGQFDKTLIQDKVWVNMTETALLRWRYNPDRNEVPGILNVKCYYGENVEKPIITRTGTNNPYVQDNLNGRVEAFVDPTDNTIFGFKIKRASKSDQKEYKCLAGFGIQIPGRNLTVDTTLSNTLILEVVEPPDLSQCLNNVQRARYNSVLEVKCYAPGNPPPDVTCQLWDENNVVLGREGPNKINVSKSFSGEETLLKLRKIVCFITEQTTGSYNKTVGENEVLVLRPPFPPKNVTRYFPEAALLTSVYLRWTPIPVVEQGGELTGYEISYWVNGKLRKDNKTDLPIQQPQLNEQGFFTHEIKDLQSDVEYKFLVYGKNQYLSDSIDPTYYSKEIIATPSDRPPTPASSTSNKNTGAIIGGVIGGVVFIIIVSVLVVYCTRRDDRQKHFPTSYVDDVVDYPPAQGGHQLYSTVEKKRIPSHDDDSTSGYPDIISTTQNGDYGNQMRSKSSSSFEPSSKVYL